MQFSLTGHVCLQTKLNLTKIKWIWARKMQRASSPTKETCSSTSQTAFFYSRCQRSVPVPLSNNLLYTQPRDAQSDQPILTNSPVFCIAGSKAAAVILKAGSSPTELNVKGQYTFTARGTLSSKLNLDRGAAWYLGDLKQKHREFPGSGGLEWAWVKMLV